jgi:hypothetical protein
MPATAMLLCMGLFSIFWLEARPEGILFRIMPYRFGSETALI